MALSKSLKNIKGKTVAIDIDGTICVEKRTFDRPLANPIEGAVQALNLLKKNKNTIILWTARGWEQYKVTEFWLKKNKFKYDQILMGKPNVDYFIDDRARKFTKWKNISV